MHRALLGAAFAAAASFALTPPAVAQSFAAGSFTASSGMRDIAVVVPPTGVRVHRGFDGRGQRDHGRRGFGFGFFPGGYYDPGDYDANRSFDPDK